MSRLRLTTTLTAALVLAAASAAPAQSRRRDRFNRDGGRSERESPTSASSQPTTGPGAQSNAVYLVGGQTARIDQGGSPPPPAPDVAVTLADAPDPVPRDGELVLTTTVLNLGSGLASAVTLRHEFSGAVRGVSVTTTQGACSSLVQLTCSLGAISPGQSVTVVQTVRPQRSGSLITTATARTPGGDQIPGNDTASVSTRVRKR